MASSLQVDSREQLYYNKYEYRATFKIKGISRTRRTKSVDEFTTRWKLMQSRYGVHKSEVDESNIKRFIIWRDTRAVNKKILIRLEQHTCSVFGNDLPFLETLSDALNPIKITYKYVDVQNIPPGVKYLKSPKYSHRLYLRCKQITQADANEMFDFFKRYKNKNTTSIEPCNALYRILDRRRGYYYLNNSYFIDYNDESTLALLGIMFPDLLGRRYKLEKRPTKR